MLGCSPAAGYFCCICELLWVQPSALAEKEGEGERERSGRNSEKKRNMWSRDERGRNERRGSKEGRKGRRKKECLFHFDKFTEIRLLAHKKNHILNFWGNSHICSAFMESIFTLVHQFQVLKQCKSSPFLSLPTNTYLPSSVGFIISILTGVKECLIVVLMCIFLIISYFEHFSLCSSHLHGFFEKCLIESIAHFWNNNIF